VNCWPKYLIRKFMSLNKMVNGQNSAIRDTLWRTIGYVVGVVVLNVYILDGN